MYKLAGIVIALFVVTAVPAEAQVVRVDPRVELLAIVFRMAGSPEYNMPNSKSPYSDDVEQQFGKFRDHPAIRMAKELRTRRGIAYDSVMNLAVHLADAPWDTRPRTPLEPRPAKLAGNWKTADAARFIEALRAFCRDSDFKGFTERHAEFYAKSAAKLSAFVGPYDYSGWFDGFFGAHPQAQFVVIIGLLNGNANYGPGMQYPDGREEITPIIGIYDWDQEGLPRIHADDVSTIAHEFCHSYVNFRIDEHLSQLKSAGDKLYSNHKKEMQKQAYSQGMTVLSESLVRGAVAYYLRSRLGEAAAAKEINDQNRLGFTWTADLVELLAEYDQHRKDYAGFDAFMPRVVTFFNEVAKKK